MNSYKTIDEYITQFPPDIQDVLQKIRQTIREAAPNAAEKISYQMPCFWQGENLIYFSAMKKHIGIYPTNSGITAFADRLSSYKTSKGSIQLPLTREIDYELIADITRFRVKEAGEKRS